MKPKQLERTQKSNKKTKTLKNADAFHNQVQSWLYSFLSLRNTVTSMTL